MNKIKSFKYTIRRNLVYTFLFLKIYNTYFLIIIRFRVTMIFLYGILKPAIDILYYGRPLSHLCLIILLPKWVFYHFFFPLVTDKSSILVAAGTDMRVRLWDLNDSSNSRLAIPAANDNIQTNFTYNARLIDGTRVVQVWFKRIIRKI